MAVGDDDGIDVPGRNAGGHEVPDQLSGLGPEVARPGIDQHNVISCFDHQARVGADVLGTETVFFQKGIEAVLRGVDDEKITGMGVSEPAIVHDETLEVPELEAVNRFVHN